MVKKIIIPNEKELKAIKKRIVKAGKNKVHVIADFDRTLTKAFYKSKKASSIISHLRNGRYLTKDYAAKAHKLFDEYHPIEISTEISEKEKIPKMYKWWRKHFDLLVESGLDKKTIKKCVKDMIKEDTLDFREGVEEFFKILKDNKIPLIIMSSSVGDIIIEFMKQKKVYSKNIHIVSNLLDFDENGKAIGIKEIVHVFNKHEMEVKGLPVYDDLLKRKNVLLLGDSLGDLGMIEGFPYENLIKIGFLNENVDALKEFYIKEYDVIILNDGKFDYINKILKKIIS
jgi:5'-nucleotidase